MARPDPGTLFKRTATRAATSPPTILSGAVSLAASAALWNPLPLILWGLGSASYILYSTTSDKNLRRVVEEDEAAARAKLEETRLKERRALEDLLDDPPFSTWTRRGMLPNYMRDYASLLEKREAILRLAHERNEIEDATEAGIQRQINYMLDAYLAFVRARVVYLRILATLNRGDGTQTPNGEDDEPPVMPALRNKPRQHGKVAPPPPPLDGPVASLPEAETLLSQLDGRIERLRELARKEPASAKAREWHIEILQKQKDLLKEYSEKDQAVRAQLEAFPDAFGVVLSRVNASRFDANDMMDTMGSIVERVEETERFVKALAPSMDEMLGSLQTG